MRYCAVSDTGRVRNVNQDRCLVHEFPQEDAWLFVVADGMGGARGGDVAAQAVVDFLEACHLDDMSTEAGLAARIRDVGRLLMRLGQDAPELHGMGATCTAMVVRGENAVWAHVGDSRLYRRRQGALTQITRDHRFVQSLVDAGVLNEEEAKNHPFGHNLDQCVGCEEFDPDTGTLALEVGDILLLSSDGLHDMISHRRIEALTAEVAARRDDVTVEAACQALLHEALEAGGQDNVTIILAAP